MEEENAKISLGAGPSRTAFFTPDSISEQPWRVGEAFLPRLQIRRYTPLASLNISPNQVRLRRI